MRLFDLISMTTRNLLRRKARTLLTMTGVIVGTCAIVVMISLGLAMTQAMEESLAQMGDLTQITIQNYGASEDSPKLNDEMLTQISGLDGVVAVTPFWDLPYMNMKIVSGRKDRYVMDVYNIKGVYSEALPHFGYQTQEGELIHPTANKKTATILFGSESAYQFYDSKRSWRNNRVDPIPDENGEMPEPFVNPMHDKMQLQLTSNEFDDKGQPKYPTITREVQVTGVLKGDNSVGWETTYYCFMDVRDARALYEEYKRVNKIKDDKNQNPNNDPNIYTEVKVKVSDIDLVSQVDDAIKALGFDTYSLDSVREPMQKQMQQQQLFLGSLAAISLLVAAIGITNTMIMSIYERTREIGVMKVLGCKVGNIRVVFLMEAGVIGFCGGVMGVGISVLISKMLNYLAMTGGLGGGAGGGGSFLAGMMGGMGMMGGGAQLSIIPGWLMLAAIVFATVIGLVAGFYPANRAVKISALEAIKHE